MSQTSIRSSLFALRTLVPAVLAVALVGMMPSWVELAHAQSYSQEQVDEIFDVADPHALVNSPDSDVSDAVADALTAAGGDEGQAAAEISGQSSIDAVAAPVTATYQNTGAIGGQISNVLADRRGGASGLSFAGVQFKGVRLKDGRVPLFEDSSAGDDSDSRIGIFLNGMGGYGTVDSSASTTGLDFHNGGLITGVDYKLSDNFLAGVSFNWIRSETDYSGLGGGVTSDSYGASLYASAFGDNAYLDVVLNYSYTDYELKRNIAGVGQNEGDTESNQIFFSALGGYSLDLSPFKFGPLARLDVVKLWMEGYNESGTALANRVPKFDVESITSNLGADLSYEFEVGSRVVTARGYGMWVHEYSNDSQSIVVAPILSPTTPITTTLASPDRNFWRVGANLSVQLTDSVELFFDYETLLNLDDVESNQFGLGGRVEF